MKAGIKECAKMYAKNKGCTLVEAEEAVRGVIAVFRTALVTGMGLSFVDLFSMTPIERKEKRGLNPTTKKPYIIKPYKSIKLSLGKALKEELNS